MRRLFFLLSLLFFNITCIFSQEDLLSLIENELPHQREKVYATFKTSKVINAQSIETVKKQTLDFRITHRFGNVGLASNGGYHTWYGWDAVSDVRFAFDYGITDQITVGIARNKYRELLDGTFKYRFLDQTTDNKMPVSVALYENIGITPMRSSQLYSGTMNVEKKFAHRFSYCSQLVLARKFNSWLSLELLPTYVHLNFVRADVNPNNGAVSENDLFSLGFAGRTRLTKRFSITFDYFQTFSSYRQNNSLNAFFAPLAIGCEIETGGHVFHLDFTNAPAINELSFIPNTSDNWLSGGFKFGFNISRVFNL